DCATNWPPVTTSGNATATMGATSSMLGTTTRDDGSTQVTYNGHPLYTVVGDTSPGQATGQGINAFGGLWYVVTTAGNAMTSGSSAGTGGGNSGYGNGGGSGGNSGDAGVAVSCDAGVPLSPAWSTTPYALASAGSRMKSRSRSSWIFSSGCP